MKRRRYEQVYDGVWIRPSRLDYKLACCDCGRVHRMKFRLLKRGNRGGRAIEMQLFRAGRRRTKARAA